MVDQKVNNSKNHLVDHIFLIWLLIIIPNIPNHEDTKFYDVIFINLYFQVKVVMFGCVCNC
jgi:hypothetical protein